MGRNRELQLFADHVIVEPEFEDSVINILRRIVKPKHGGRVVIDFTTDATVTAASEHFEDGAGSGELNKEATSFKVPVVKTFIHFVVPSSLYTPSCATRAKTD